MRWMTGRPTPRTLLSLLGLLILPLLMADETRAAGPTERLTILTANAPTTLDPHRAITGSDFQLMGHLYDSLINREMFNPVPGLLSAWESVDQRVWRLHVSGGHWFGIGRPVTARDIAYSLCRWGALNRGGTGQNLSVRRASVQPDNVVLLELERPYARITSAFFLIFGVEAPAAFTDRSCTPDMPVGLLLTSNPPTGSGPYRLAAHEPGGEYRLKTAPPIKGVPPATFEEVVLRVEPDGQARVRALADGQADIIEDPPPAPLAYLPGLTHISLTELPTDRSFFLSLNLSGRRPGEPLARGHPALVDLRVRRALALAISKPLLAQRATDGYGLPANQLGGPGMRGFLPDRPPDTYDPAAARDLLRAAGYDDGLTLELLTSPTRGSDGGRTADVLAGMLSAAGIKVNVRRVGRDEFRQQVLDGRFDLALGLIGIEDGIVLSGYDAMLRPSPARNVLNPGRYQDAEVTRLLLAAESDPAAIDPAMRDIQAILDRDTPFIPLLHLRDLVLHRSDLIVAPRDTGRVLGRAVTLRDGTPVR
jgi:peptide/nickel transport system substrate-binding protein